LSSANWSVEANDERVATVDPDGRLATIAMRDLYRVVIETNDSGPFGEDVWWLLLGPNERVAVRFPQSADGERGAVDVLLKLPNFDYEQMITAMGSTDHAFFPVWRRSDEG
jgi:hypothetical protein